MEGRATRRFGCCACIFVMSRIRVLVTGGTFDKEYDELTGQLFFRDTHAPEMLRRGRCRLDVTLETVMMVDSLDMSPDGQQLAVSRPARVGEAQNDIWLIDLATGRATPLTDDHAGDYDPTWSPDGKYIVFNSGRLGGQSLFLRASDGSGVDVPLAKFEKSESNRFTVASWSRAGVLIFNVLKKTGDVDLWTLSISGDRTPKVFVSSKQSELNGTFSPDGRWVAYQANASNRYEIVVRRFPNKDPARTISRDGGKYPRWRGDGKELFFVSPAGTMMAAGFDATNGASQGEPQPLFRTQIRVGDNRPYAVEKFGQRFLLKVGPDPQMVVVMDWRTLLDR